MKHNLQNKSTRFLSIVCLLLSMLLSSQSSFAQLTGSITVPSTNYPSIKSVVDSLNLYGPGPGGVTFNIAAGTTETAIAPGYKLTATGTAANPIVIRKDPSTTGANPLITAYVGTSTTLDGVFFLLGSDYVTINGIDIQESGTNSTATTQMEWGYALLKGSATAPFNGCMNNTIQNCSITLNKANVNSRGIYMNNHVATALTQLNLFVPANDCSNNNKFYGNKIQNVFQGIFLGGYSSVNGTSVPLTLLDQNNDIGGSSYATADTMTNLGVGSSSGGSLGTLGISVAYQNNINISYNFIDNFMGGGSGATATATGIYATNPSVANAASITLNNNYINITQGNAIMYLTNINNFNGTITANNNVLKMNNTTLSTSASYGMYFTNSSSAYGVVSFSLKNNTFANDSVSNSTGTVYVFAPTSMDVTTEDISGNTIDNFKRLGGTTGQFYCFYRPSTTNYNTPGTVSNVYNNTINNISYNVTGASAFYGFYLAGPFTSNYYNNSITNITSTSTGAVQLIYPYYGGGDVNIYNNRIDSISSAGTLNGIVPAWLSFAGNNVKIYKNTVSNMTSSGAGSVVAGIYAYYGGSISNSIYGNKVFNITASGTGSSIAQGIFVNHSGISGTIATTVSVYNNIVGNINAPNSTSTTPCVIGINMGQNAYTYTGLVANNSVVLNGTGGPNSNSAGIYISNISPVIKLNNNLIVNKTVHSGTGIASAYQRFAVSLTTFDAASNNNLVYAGTPSLKNLLYFDGTNKDSILRSFKARLSPREVTSFTENTTLLGALPTSANYLQTDSTVASLTEGGGLSVSGITTDFRGVTRNASKPDIGAYEFNGIAPPMVVDSVIVDKNTANALVNKANQIVMRIAVYTQGTAAAGIVTRLKLNTSGSTNVADISNAKVFYTSYNSTFSTATQFGTTIVSPNGTFYVNGNQSLNSGDNYFWLVYDLPATATLGNTIDARLDSVLVSGINKDVFNGNPAGGRIVSAPLSGTYTIGTGTYTTLAKIVDDLNANGVSGAVVINLPVGFTEVAPAKGYVLGSAILNPTVSATNTIRFQKSGSSPNPLLTANVGTTTTLDGIFTLAGVDYVTIDGIDLVDPVSNSTAAAQMEWGYGMLKLNAVAPFDGCQNNTIRNCVVTLQRINTTSKGIYVNNHIPTDVTQLSITATSDANSYNKFYSNTVQNANTCIYLNGFATSSSVANFALYDQSNIIGDSIAGVNMGNNIYNFGGITLGYGINAINQAGHKIANNNIDNANGGIAGLNTTITGINNTYTYSSGANPSSLTIAYNIVNIAQQAGSSGAVYDIFLNNTHGDIVIKNNDIRFTTAAGTAATGQFAGIVYNQAGGSYYGNSLVFKNNICVNQTLNTTGIVVAFWIVGGTLNDEISENKVLSMWRTATSTATTFAGIYIPSTTSAAVTTAVKNVHDNTVNDLNNGTGVNSVYGLYVGGTYTTNVYNNSISNLSEVGSASAPIYGLYLNGSVLYYNVYNNSVTGLNGSAANVYGVFCAAKNAVTSNLYNNKVLTLTSAGAATIVSGIYISDAGLNLNAYGNDVNGVSVTGTGTCSASGIFQLNAVAGTSSVKIYNNKIAGIAAATSTATTAPSAVGLNMNYGTTLYSATVSYNTISMSGAGAPASNSAGVYVSSIIPIVKMSNNIISNTTSHTTGINAAYYHNGAALTTYDLGSDNNLYYAGPALTTKRYIYYDGTNKDSSLATFKTRMYPREVSSVTEDITYYSTTAGTSGYLIPDSTIATVIESGATPVSGINFDFNGRARSASNPDIGAVEANYTLSDVLAPVISFKKLTNPGTLGNITFTATITDVTGISLVASQPRVYYKKSSLGSMFSSLGTLVSGTSKNGTWSFTIVAGDMGGLLMGDSVYYFVVAQDILSNFGSVPLGAGGTNVAAAIEPVGSYGIKVIPGMSGNYTVCATGCDFSSLTNTSGAFHAIDTSSLTGDVALLISGNLTAETGTKSLDQWAESGNGNYTVSVMPNSATERLIAGNVATSLITFNGADRVKIDGRFNGSGKYLRIRNRNTGSSAVIKFMNDARRDTIHYAFIEGLAPFATIYFNTPATGGTGNDSNAVMYCVISDTLGTPTTGTVPNSVFYSDQSWNSENTIAYNQIYNYLYQGLSIGSGLSGTDNWVITGNSFYQLAAGANKTGTTSSATQAVNIQSGNGHIITNNSIGGSAPDRSGSAYKAPFNTTGVTFHAIYLSVGVNTPTTVSGNTISNIVSNPSGITSQACFAGINVIAGLVNITSNTIGGGAMPYDTIMEGSYTSPLGAGIFVSGGIVTISNNIIGNITNYNVNTTGPTTAGIYATSSGAGPNTYTITNNIVRDIRSMAPSGTGVPSFSTYSNSPAGIVINANASTPVNVEGNTVYNITNINTGTAMTLASGITLRAGICTVQKNRIYNINVNGTGTGIATPYAMGMYVTTSTGHIVRNNQISLSPNNTNETQVRGILDNALPAALPSNNYYNNSIFIGGTAAGSTSSYAFQHSGAAIVNVYNNILYNKRSGGTGSQFAYGDYATSGVSGATFNYNLLVTPDANKVAEIPTGTSVSAAGLSSLYLNTAGSNWMSTVPSDSAQSLFVDTAAGNLGLNAANAASWYANGKGLPMASVANDFTGAVRSTTIAGGATDIGAVEVTPSVAPASAVASAAPAVNTTTTYTYGNRTVASVTWGAAGTVPTALDVKYYSGTNAPAVFTGAARYNSYYAVTPIAGTGYTYTIALAYDSAVMGTVGSSIDSRMAYHQSPTWTWLSASSANATTGMLSSGGSLAATTLPANFTGTHVVNPLPVKLVTFAGTAVSGDVQLGWTTASELNNNGFEVERSLDGKSFEKVGSVKGAGNSSQLLNYGMVDAKAFAIAGARSLYYRLRQVDMDGSATYSSIINVTDETAETMNIGLYPNPTAAMFNISAMVTTAGVMNIAILDLQGKTVASFNRETSVGMNTMEIDGSLLNKAGIYFVKVTMNGESKVMKLVKQ